MVLVVVVIFSQPYFGNDQAVVMVVVHLSVRQFVTDVLTTVAKRCKAGPRLLLITNRKLHTGFQITYKSSTLDNLDGH